jgi:hypothetical protein
MGGQEAQMEQEEKRYGPNDRRHIKQCQKKYQHLSINRARTRKMLTLPKPEHEKTSNQVPAA